MCQPKPCLTVGNVLLLMMIMLQILVLLTLYEWQHVSIMGMTANESLARMDLENHADLLLRHIEQKAGDKNCNIPPTTIKKLLLIPFSKWPEFACTGREKNNRFFYVVESLGSDACSLIKILPNGNKVVADYLRITLVLQTLLPHTKQIIMQSSIARDSETSLPCLDSLHFVKVGRQMSREF